VTKLQTSSLFIFIKLVDNIVSQKENIVKMPLNCMYCLKEKTGDAVLTIPS
jgi:hypothetical protein